VTDIYQPAVGTEWALWQDLATLSHGDHLRLILADFLEERGRGPHYLGGVGFDVPSDEDLAYALRWAVARHKRPLRGEQRWEWHSAGRHFDEPEYLPPLVLQATPAVTRCIARSLPEAYQALARALRTLKDLWSLNP
jgi:hypothetical protein